MFVSYDLEVHLEVHKQECQRERENSAALTPFTVDGSHDSSVAIAAMYRFSPSPPPDDLSYVSPRACFEMNNSPVIHRIDVPIHPYRGGAQSPSVPRCETQVRDAARKNTLKS